MKVLSLSKGLSKGKSWTIEVQDTIEIQDTIEETNCVLVL